MHTPELFSATVTEEVARRTLRDDLIAQIWRELGGKVSQDRIRQVATDVEVTFRDATVTAYIPILMRRKICQRLLQDVATEEEQP